AVVALLLVVRPMVVRLTGPVLAAPLAAEEHAAFAVGEGLPALAAPAGGAAVARLAEGRSHTEATAPLADDRLLAMANVEGQLRASSIRRIADLVERNPQESLTIVRNWLAQGST